MLPEENVLVASFLEIYLLFFETKPNITSSHTGFPLLRNISKYEKKSTDGNTYIWSLRSR